MKSTTVTGVAFLLAILSTSVAAQTIAPERVRNIEKAGAEIGAIQKKSGANGAFAAIQDCYKRELAQAKSLTPQLEACMAQDIIVSQVTAEVYARFPTKGRDPDAVLKAMSDRVIGTMARFKVPQDTARAFTAVVKTRGMAAYGKAQ
jgi:hypothetical protein